MNQILGSLGVADGRHGQWPARGRGSHASDAGNHPFHDFVSPKTRPTSFKKFANTCCGLVNAYRTPLLRAGRGDGRRPDADLRFDIVFVDLGQQSSVPMNRTSGCCHTPGDIPAT
ncbi:hypothetical protein [Rhodanobacter glycinis]|uniref:hypothetical protein n=1 Tax=Rhodanobacter glycinis TaxID=582702 RepID=UPI00112E16A7|nr:hypothetical protein [Rhodanobacter glycinis]